jgi:hypothetical protein
MELIWLYDSSSEGEPTVAEILAMPPCQNLSGVQTTATKITVAEMGFSGERDIELRWNLSRG